MTVVYAFYPGDADLALKNAKWWNELGGCKGHNCVLIHDLRCAHTLVDQIGVEITKSFDNVHVMRAGAVIDGWPQGANYFFKLAACFLQDRRRGAQFFWMEPDAIPLRKGWLDAIQDEYKQSGKPFMGDRVEVKLDGKEVPLHMSGVGIYPNPLHAYSGEAYRAHEIAWDMAGKDQIVPQAHFTKLIEHAWKHPSFKDHSELATQIRSEAVLFHSSKDGSLIDLLRGRETETRNAHNVEKVGSTPTPANFSLSQDSERSTVVPSEAETKTGVLYHGRHDLSCDIFIRTYPEDYAWLAYCVLSIHRFCTGFRKIVVVSPQEQPSTVRGVEWKVMQDETQDGYLAQQVTKLYADVISDYQPDYILHVDSDVIFTRPVTPQDFLDGDKVIWPFTPYTEIQTPWQPITEKFMGQPVPNEFMRRFPIMIPRWLYPKLREFCYKQHKMIVSQYIHVQPLRSFSEFNALGAYAYKYHKDMFHFINTLEQSLPEPFAKQFYSWGGLTPEIQNEIESYFQSVPVLAEPQETQSKASDTQSGEARESTKSVRSSEIPAKADSRGGLEIPPQGVRELDFAWVLENDTHVSKWVEQEQRLDHDQNTLPFILPHIKEGDVVVDCGAFIGDHTIAYSKKVGAAGAVYAFEPNPLAYTCLQHNLRDFKNTVCLPVGLGDKTETVPLSGNNGNAAGSYVGEHMKVANVELQRLDDMQIRPPALIKIDAEGYDLRVLRGAKQTILKHKPILVIEINYTALSRQGEKVNWIYDWLERNGYNIKIMQENCSRISPMYDILCIPAGVSPRATDTEANHRCCSSASTPPDSPKDAVFSDEEKMVEYINWLAQYAGKNPKNRQSVVYRLSRRGLKARNPIRKHK